MIKSENVLGQRSKHQTLFTFTARMQLIMITNMDTELKL